MTDVRYQVVFENFLKKYNIKDYSLIKHDRDRYVIFNNEDNYYYKLSGLAGGVVENDLHYFLNNAHFPNHLVLSIIDTELNLRIIKSSPAPGNLAHDILNTIDKTYIIKMMEWLKWQHTESRRIFPKITNKYFICLGVFNDTIDLHANNIVYDKKTYQFTPIDFEVKKNWINKEEYISYTFNGISEVLTSITMSSNSWLSIRQYPKSLDYCIEYIYEKIL